MGKGLVTLYYRNRQGNRHSNALSAKTQQIQKCIPSIILEGCQGGSAVPRTVLAPLTGPQIKSQGIHFCLWNEQRCIHYSGNDNYQKISDIFSFSVKRHAYTHPYIGVRYLSKIFMSGEGVFMKKQNNNKGELQKIKSMIYKIRGYQVMLDADLAEIYQVETKRLNEAVKRNIDRFPPEFMFRLTKDEYENLKSQFVTSK